MVEAGVAPGVSVGAGRRAAEAKAVGAHWVRHAHMREKRVRHFVLVIHSWLRSSFWLIDGHRVCRSTVTERRLRADDRRRTGAHDGEGRQSQRPYRAGE
jgi:hypothetical protein